MWKWIVHTVVVLALFSCLGCVAAPAMPKEFANALNQAVEKVADQGILEDWLTNARAHGLNPNIRSELGWTAHVSIGFEGIDADINMEAGGGGTKLPKDVRAAYIQLLGWPGLTAEERAEIMAKLEWNRPEVP